VIDITLQILGVVLMSIVLADVFLTVLYVRSGTSLLSDRLARWCWRLFRLISKLLPQWRDKLLSYCGGIVLLLIISVWVALLTIGFALIALPNIGSGIKSSHSNPSHPWATAVYYSGANLATAGTPDIAPRAAGLKIVAVAMPLLGMFLITLTVTYLLQVYNALMRRNTFALSLHFATRCTGDGAELLAGLGAGGDFSSARSDMGALATELANLYEAHHFYSTLLYFRFRDPRYALSRVAIIAMDATTLIRTALDSSKYRSIQECAATNTLWEAGTNLLGEMARILLPSEYTPPNSPPDEKTARQWRDHYHAAAARLRQAGISTTADEAAGVEEYLRLRQKWDRPVRGFAAYMCHDLAEVDPAVVRR